MGKQRLSKETQRSIIYLITLSLARAGIQIALYRQGFISVAADEFARGIRAATWAANPHVNILADVQGTWLPFEKYLNGLLLLVFPDVILAPRLTVFVASCLVLAAVYWLAYHLFGEGAAVLSTLFLTFQPWFVWLSGTPMLEMYYFAFFFAGLFFIIMWLKESRKGYWLWAGSCFLLASGFHVQSWTFINIVNLFTLPTLYQFVRRKEYANLSRLFAYYVLGNGLIIGYVLIEYIYTGHILTFLAKHTSYSKWFYNGYDVSAIDKFLYYPKLIVQHTSGTLWLGLFAALFFVGRNRGWQWKLFPLLLAILTLLLNSVMNLFSGPPSAAPGRYSLFYMILLSFYMGYGTYRLFLFGNQQTRQLMKVSLMTAALALFLYGVGWGANRISEFPRGVAIDAVEVGRDLDTLLSANPGRFMVELHYWDYLGINLTAHHFDAILFDREKNLLDRTTPSIFLQEPSRVCEELLQTPELRYVSLKDETLKARAQDVNILRLYRNVGTWTIYEVIPASERDGKICG